jgi:phosphopantetheine adenylyltransferase
MSKTSPLFTANELYTHVCCDCANELYDDAKAKYKDEKMALIILCHYLDVYFSEELYENVKNNANFSYGNYSKLLNGTQYKAKNFTTYLVNELKTKAEQDAYDDGHPDKEVGWSASDRKNKAYVLQTVGYDCFDDENYTDANRKFLFNTLADYLTDDVIEDPHKMQSVISLVKTTLQVENVDRLINSEFRQKIPDNTLIKSLTEIKDKLSRTINSSANDNGISAKGSGKGSKGSNTLTNIMKEMAENGFDEIKVNVVDIKMSTSYQEIAKDNAKALFDELNLTSDEYARMVATQAEMIDDYQTKITKLEEIIRLLKIENKALKAELDGDR